MALFKTVLIHILILVAANLVFTQSSYGDVQQSPPDDGPPVSHDEGNEENYEREVAHEPEIFDPREGYEDHDGMVEPSQTQPNGEDPQSRFFFSLLGSTLTTCNYTRQAGRTCTACRRTLTCFRSNVGLARTCRGLFRYCRNGRCSLFPGPACSSATATTTAAATTAAATTAAGTTTG